MKSKAIKGRSTSRKSRYDGEIGKLRSIVSEITLYLHIFCRYRESTQKLDSKRNKQMKQVVEIIVKSLINRFIYSTKDTSSK